MTNSTVPHAPPSEVDVLIIGAGPAGLMASLYLSELGISHRILDQRGTRTLIGRADGFHERTVEIWESFGFVHKETHFAASFGEWALWTFDEQKSGEGIRRVERNPDNMGLGKRLFAGLLSQPFIEAALGEAGRVRGGPRVERGARPKALKVEEGTAGDHGDYAVTVEVQHLKKEELESSVTGSHQILEDGSVKAERGYIDAYGTDPWDIVPRVNGQEGTTETIKAKYLIGTDGAHSWVRHQLPDFRMEGDSTDACYGVIDIVPITDFPDIRKTASVLSQAGFLFTIPRENGLVRLYVQFPENYKNAVPANREDVSICADIMDAARAIFAPYKLEYKYCDWWTIYKVGQRVCNHASYLDRVFLAGDAIHTHSPKGGQGMNVSQQDTYNLSWKVAAVLRGQLPPSILSTYETERLPVARELISLDKDMSTVLSARADRDEEEVKRVYKRLENSSGTNICYPASSLVADARQEAAPTLKLGMRLPDAEVWSQGIGQKIPLQTLLKSNGYWRLLVFAGDVKNPTRLDAVNAMGDKLHALARKYPSLSPKHDKFLEILLFHSSATSELESRDFHETFFPVEEFGGRNYHTIFGARHGESRKEPTENVYQMFGIDEEKGAMVVVRPDQTISWVGELGDLEKLEAWFASLMIARKQEKKVNGINGTI